LLATFVLDAEHADTGRATEEHPSGAMPCQRAANIRMMWPLQNAKSSPPMPWTQTMKRSARAATS
jgi:hypothetical protein